MTRVFFSYSHVDEAMRDELEKHLAVLKRDGTISTFHDRRISAGDHLHNAISAELERADLVLLLVSPDFLSSGYCYELEFARALERHHASSARIIPVILRPCDWKATPLADLLGLPQDNKPITQWADRDQAFLNVAQGVRAALETAGKVGRREVLRANTVSPREARPVSGPRSSNLRLRKGFSDAQRDRFLDEGFEFMKRFFDGSLAELRERNPDIETSLKVIDGHTFTAAIYRSGKKVASCIVRLSAGRHAFGSGLTYSATDSAPSNSFNENLSVDVDDQAMFLRPLGLSHFGDRRDAKLSHEGGAELFWSLLIEPLQS